MDHGMTIERIAIIGAGAIGAAYASMLLRAGPGPVFFIAEGERAGTLEAEGRTVNGRNYILPVARPHLPSSPADLIIVAVKYHHLAEAIGNIRAHVGKETIILSFMNGIDSEERIGSAFGMERVLYSMVLGIDAVRVGATVTFSTSGRVFFGEARNGSYSRRVLRVKDLLERAGIGYEIPEDMIRTLWWKFMINTGINQAQAALRVPYGAFQAPGEGRDLMDSAMREVALIAGKQGIILTEDDIRNWHAVLAGLSPDGKTSMLQDVEAGRKTEVEMLAGKVIELGERFAIPTPVNRKLRHLIRGSEE
jgi:2-dehydropantoate 2-reductase